MEDYDELKPIYGCNFADRRYFPQIGFIDEYGVNEYTFEGGIQFAPWDQLTIFGGKAFTALTYAYGSIWDRKRSIGTEKSCWRSSMDFGVRITNAFGILLSIGVAESNEKTSPFISLDIGKVRL